MTYQDLLQIVELIKSSSHFGEFHLKTGDLEVDLKRGADGSAHTLPTSAASQAVEVPHQVGPAANASARAASEEQTPVTSQRHGHVGGGEIVVEPTAPARGLAPTGAHAPPVAYPPGAVLVKSPMVGSFYRAAEPGARPFAEVGQRVEADTTVCIIEVMKLMNSITAGRNGVVTHILVGDGDPVEYGQVLMVVDPV
jgi:acetyl-CoA carboxylase biotin carboxyl carrier protein